MRCVRSSCLPLLLTCLMTLTLRVQAQTPAPEPAPRLQIVTTLFPLFDWAREIGGDRVAVTQILPPGVEAHSFAPRPSDLISLHNAGVFIFLGPDMEPWAADLIKGLQAPKLKVLEAGRTVARAQDDHDCQGDHDHVHATDPHIWLDPVLAQNIVNEIAATLAAADPDGRDFYIARAAQYNASLGQLHTRIAEALKNVRHREILYAGHFAFGYFARRYGLTHRSPYPGFSPNAAPAAAQIIDMIKAFKASGQTTLFHEELLDPRVGRIITEETGAKLVILHSLHNLSKDDRQKSGITYLSLMEQNLQKLQSALN